MAHRYFISRLNGDEALITGPEAQHIIKVMRLGPGDVLTLSNKDGFDYTARITAAESGQVTCRVISKKKNLADPKRKLTVFMALPKSDKLEFITQKMCELGAVRLIPFVSEYCVAQKSKKDESKTARLQKISDEACKQCARSTPMEVSPTMTMAQILPMMKEFDKVLLFYEKGSEKLSDINFDGCENTAVIIGSEGGFSPREAEKMQRAGAASLLLGQRILRCETAAVTAAGLTMFCLGEME